MLHYPSFVFGKIIRHFDVRKFVHTNQWRSKSLQFFSKSLLSVTAVIGIGYMINNDIMIENFTSHCQGSYPLSRNFVADVVSEVSPAVVNIRSAVDLHYTVATSSGSGFIISKDGFIVTNAHVVEKSSDGRVLVTMKNGVKRVGRVHSMDKLSDVALVKLEEVSDDLPVITMGNSSKLRAGEFVVSIGSPLTLQDSVSFGIVSAVARHGTELGVANNRSEYIQTDAAINQGNSGGPLVNMDGEVIGINTMTIKGSEGIAFAIPIDIASQVVKQLLARGTVVRPYIGLRMADVAETAAGVVKKGKKSSARNMFDLKESRVMVLDVTNGSPAQKAGLQSGDMITEVDGKPVLSVRDVLDAVGLEPGHRISFKVARPSKSGGGDYEQLSLSVYSAAENKRQ